MKVHTYQLAKWRRIKALGILALDTTVKTGAWQVAPSWDLVLGIKKKLITQEEYTRRYYEMLEYNLSRDPAFFYTLRQEPEVALGCYCPPKAFCHRLLLVEFLKRLTDIEYLGELD